MRIHRHLRLELTAPLTALVILMAASPALRAAPYASHVEVSGTTVNFILNEPADVLSYSLNGGAAVTLDGTTKGAKTFMLGAASDMFAIVADKNAAVGYTIPTGGTVFNVDTVEPILLDGTHGLREPSPEAGFNVVSDDDSLLARFNSPRGVSVSLDPNAPNFGTAYIANSAAGTQAASGRNLGDGMYALRADGTDAFGYGDTAQNPQLPDTLPAFSGDSASSPYRVYVAADGLVYVSDWFDNNSNVFQLPPNLSSAINAFPGFVGSTTLPAGQNHGSVPAVHVEGSIATGDLKIYTIDEDLTTNHVTGAGSTTDSNSLWRYDVNSGPLPSSVVPVHITDVGIPVANTDMSRGPDGKWYVSQSRFDVQNSPTLYVVSADGSTVLFNSLTASQAINPGTTNDILQYITATAVSPDGNWLAGMLNGSDVAIFPLVDGIPQIEDRMVVRSAVDPFNEFSGRDVAFDAAGNIHYVSSGQGRYRVLAPGGHTVATTSWNGTQFAFDVETVDAPGDDADFDGDGDVDGADFLTWQRGLGISDGSADLADGDANDDGNVTAADLEVWKMQYATAVAAAGPVPEPATWGLAALAALACVFWSLPRRQVSLAPARTRRPK